MPKTPSYRKRAGYAQALVTLTDSATKRRRDYWLGEYGTPESRERYHRLIAEWEAMGRRWPERTPGGEGAAPARGPTVAEVAIAYWRWVEAGHRAKRASNIRMALRLLRRMDGPTPAGEYGPRRLLLLREAMVRGDADDEPPRRAWSRVTANDRTRVVVSMFRWAVAREMVDESVWRALAAVEPLKRGRSAAKEPEPVTPVPEAAIEAVRPHLSRPVRALVELQLLTGARPGELLGMCAVDLETDAAEGVWVYRPREHKCAHRGKQRSIYLGPRAQALLQPFLAGRAVDAPLFSPAEAEAERRAAMHAARRTPAGYGNRPGTNRKASPRRRAGSRYTTDSYRRAIAYACDRAFPPPERLGPREGEAKRAWLARLTEAERAELRLWQRDHRWHPHRLRHNAATRLRREHGLEAAQLVLGHSSAEVTDAVYAERDAASVVRVMRQAG